MKEKIAVAISIISFALIYFGLDTIADTLGVPTYIDFGETVTVTRGSGRYSYDEDIDGESTDVGMFILIASIMLAWRIYHWVVSGKFNGNISKESHTTWLFWLVGMTAYILVTTPIWQIDMPGILQRIIVLGCGAGIAWFTYNKHGEAIANIRGSNDDNT
jgi:hypothetical protein